MAEYEEDGALSGPYALVHLPDGRAVYATVRSRQRDQAGVWWYELEIDHSTTLSGSGSSTSGRPFPPHP